MSESATSFHDVHETTTLKKRNIVFTEGSTIRINAPAEKVFDIIMAFDKYNEWNTWCPKFEFKENEKIAIGSEGVMHANMEKQNKVYKIPEEILEIERDSKQFKLAWVGKLLPSWAGKAERVQLVTPVEGNSNQSEVKQWESMSGFASHIFKHLMGVPKQLEEQNLRYVKDLKKRAEELHGQSSTTTTS